MTRALEKGLTAESSGSFGSFSQPWTNNFHIHDTSKAGLTQVTMQVDKFHAT